jgi:hypothetical protein
MYGLALQGKSSEDALQETFPLYYGIIGAVILILLFISFKKESGRILRYSHASDSKRL